MGSELLAEADAEKPLCDRWGVGAPKAWESRMQFDRRGRGESTPPYDASPSDMCASLCAGNAEKLHLGDPRSKGIVKAFREVLTAAGQDVTSYEQVNKELYAAAQARP